MKNLHRNLFVPGLILLSVGLIAHAQNDMSDMKSMEAPTFKSLHAPTQGKVTFQKNTNGTYTLRLEGLKTEAAPDLEVWLYKKAVQGEKDVQKMGGSYLKVGTLKKFQGNFTFKLPAGVSPEQYKSVVLWCDLVATPFAAANLYGEKMNDKMN